MENHKLSGIKGKSGSREVILGFANARLLYSLSFVDILNEDSGIGYQRRFHPQHSLDFRKYIQCTTSTTIPLTFNLRHCNDNSWNIKYFKNGSINIFIKNSSKKFLSQVDCQHRLGHLSDIDVELPFMIFIGMSIREEMEVFNVINSKAKGLNTSLLDFHQTQLEDNLIQNKPELYIAMQLNEFIESPWYKQLDLGGNKTVGMKRRASFRTMQRSVKKYLLNVNAQRKDTNIHLSYIINFWKSIHFILNKEWEDSRKHIINKGIGVYALMHLAAQLYNESFEKQINPDLDYVNGQLSDFITRIDWTNSGPFKGLGGQGGVKEAINIINSTRIELKKSQYA